MPRASSRPSDLAQRWEVRAPLRHGSRLVGYYVSEEAARRAASEIEARHFPGAGLQIHTKSRVVYINHTDDI